MNRSLTLSATIAATGLLFASVGALAKQPPNPPNPPKPPGNGGGGANAVTIAAKPNPISFGGFVTISGRVTGNNAGGRTVTLEADPYPFADAGFAAKGTKVTDNNGNYSIAQAPGLNTRYRVVVSAPATTSTLVTVSVAYRVGLSVSDSTPRRGTSVRFSGSVGPRKDGSIALIQKRRSNGSFVTVARANVVAGTATRSVYSKRLRISSSGVYRVRVSGDAAHVAGNSRTRTLTVH